MASETRPQTDDLIARLSENPWSFDFFQAVRRLENLRPERARTGHSHRLADDHVRFLQEPSLAFAPSTIRSFGITGDGPAPRMFVSFLGLLGPNGPLPLHLTEYARDREINHHDHATARFLDVFNHRMISLFYRAWAANQIAVNYERGEDDRFSTYFGSLLGIGMASLTGRDRLSDDAKLHFTGHLSNQTKHADGLRQILEDYFGVPCDIGEFVGQWIELPHDCRCRLGESPATGVLGRTAVVGSRMWEAQQRFRVRFGPMSLKDYQRLLPIGDSLGRLVDWVRLYTCDELGWDVQLVLRRAEVPALELGTQGRLGWTTWLSSKPFTEDADDLVLNPRNN